MTQKLYKPVASSWKPQDDSPFSGIWIRWSALNIAERFVCANITLLPVWWVLGLFGYMSVLILMSIVLYEWRYHGGLRLKSPSLAVIALFAYYAYNYLDTFLLFFDAHPLAALPSDAIKKPDDLVQSALSFVLPCLIWYIQSNDVRVRLKVVAWACSVSIVQMLIGWLLFQFVFPGAFEPPPLSLYGMLTGKGAYLRGSGRGNYLTFYEDGRLQFFFNGYQSCSIFLSFIGLLALNLKNRLWSLLLLVACVFLAVLVGSRSVLLAFPAALFIHYLFMATKVKETWLLFALVAMISFITLSVPPVTNLVFGAYTGTTTSVNGLRPRSSEVRGEIYQETLERIPDKLLLGHKVEGQNTLSNALKTDPKLGSHSFILGDLLYQGGLVSLVLFMTFWVSLMTWLYNTRVGRPTCWLSIMVLFILVLAVTDFVLTISMGILVCMTLRRPVTKSLIRSAA